MVGARWRSRGIGKPGRRQAKTRRKTCEEKRVKIARKIQKNSKPKPSETRPRRTKNRPKTMENRRKTGFGRLWALRVVLVRSVVTRKRARDGLRTASWAVLDAKLAVLAAMLAVLDAKLPAQEHPNGVRSRPWPLFEQESKIERRLYRFFIVFVLSRKTSDVHSVPVFTMFCCS